VTKGGDYELLAGVVEGGGEQPLVGGDAGFLAPHADQGGCGDAGALGEDVQGEGFVEVVQG
jgi:hypothetical protein